MDHLLVESMIVKCEAEGGEYMQSIDGRPKQLLMSQNNRGRDICPYGHLGHMVGWRKSVLCPYVTSLCHNPRLWTYARMLPMNYFASAEAHRWFGQKMFPLTNND